MLSVKSQKEYHERNKKNAQIKLDSDSKIS